METFIISIYHFTYKLPLTLFLLSFGRRHTFTLPEQSQPARTITKIDTKRLRANNHKRHEQMACAQSPQPIKYTETSTILCILAKSLIYTCKPSIVNQNIECVGGLGSPPRHDKRHCCQRYSAVWKNANFIWAMGVFRK